MTHSLQLSHSSIEREEEKKKHLEGIRKIRIIDMDSSGRQPLKQPRYACSLYIFNYTGLGSLCLFFGRNISPRFMAGFSTNTYRIKAAIVARISSPRKVVNWKKYTIYI